MDKKPTVKWEEYQRRQPSDEEVRLWFLNGGERVNVAVVCGRVSQGLVVLDFEREEDFKAFFTDEVLKNTLVVRTPHHGIHVWFREVGEVPRRSIRVSEDHPLDLLGEGGYVLAPPSIINHARCDRGKCVSSGVGEYVVISSTYQILEVKGVFRAVVERARSLGWRLKEKPRIEAILHGVPEGMRNNAAFQYARYLLFRVKLDPQTVWCELRRWKSLNNLP